MSNRIGWKQKQFPAQTHSWSLVILEGREGRTVILTAWYNHPRSQLTAEQWTPIPSHLPCAQLRSPTSICHHHQWHGGSENCHKPGFWSRLQMRVTRRKNMFTKPTTESQLRTTEQHLPCAPPVQPQLRRASWLLLTAGESWAWERNSQSQSPLQTCPSTALTSAMAPKRAEASRALPSGTVLDSHPAALWALLCFSPTQLQRFAIYLPGPLFLIWARTELPNQRLVKL